METQTLRIKLDQKEDWFNQEREVDVRQDFNLFRNSGLMTSAQKLGHTVMAKGVKDNMVRRESMTF